MTSPVTLISSFEAAADAFLAEHALAQALGPHRHVGRADFRRPPEDGKGAVVVQGVLSRETLQRLAGSFAATPIFLHGVHLPAPDAEHEDLLRELSSKADIRLASARDAASLDMLSRGLAETDVAPAGHFEPVLSLPVPFVAPARTKTIGVCVDTDGLPGTRREEMSAILRAAEQADFSVTTIPMAFARSQDPTSDTGSFIELCRQIGACSVVLTDSVGCALIAAMYALPAMYWPSPAFDGFAWRSLRLQGLEIGGDRDPLSRLLVAEPAPLHGLIVSRTMRRAREGMARLTEGLEKLDDEIADREAELFIPDDDVASAPSSDRLPTVPGDGS